MPWNSIWPNGAVSVRSNSAPGLQNTAYIESNLNKDHYWNIGANEDGHHKQVQMPKQASDVTLATGMDGAIYLKDTAAGSTQGFYINAAGIYQFIPSHVSGTVNITSQSNYTNIVSVPNNVYGLIYIFGSLTFPSMTMAYFRAQNGICEAYSSLTFLNDNTGTANSCFVFGNGSSSSGLNIRARAKTVSPGFFDYRIVYWQI